MGDVSDRELRRHACRLAVRPGGLVQRDAWTHRVGGCDECRQPCPTTDMGLGLVSEWGRLVLIWPCPRCGRTVHENAPSPLGALDVAREVAADGLCYTCRRQ